VFYFAYGSNMASARLCVRVPSAAFHCTAVLPGYRFACSNRSHDGSAKGTIISTGRREDAVHGVVFAIDPDERALLDAAEGLHYRSVAVDVGTQRGTEEVMTYIGITPAPDLRPYHWYREWILRGAHEHRLPPDYIATWLEPIVSIPDPDPAQHDT